MTPLQKIYRLVDMGKDRRIERNLREVCLVFDVLVFWRFGIYIARYIDERPRDPSICNKISSFINQLGQYLNQADHRVFDKSFRLSTV